MSAEAPTTMAELLPLVVAGRVSWRDPHPRLAERTGMTAPRWHIDGVEAYGAQIRSLDRLVDRGLIEATAGEVAHALPTSEQPR